MRTIANFLLVSLVALAAPVLARAETLRLVTEEFEPFNYSVGGKATGPGIEIAGEICARLKLECSFHVLPLRRATQEITDGDSHVLFSVARTPEREQVMRFSRPFIQTGYSFFVLQDQGPKLDTLEDLKGITVSAFGPSGTYSSLERIAQRAGGLKLVQEAAFDTPFRKLEGGRYGPKAAVYANRHVGAVWLKKEGLGNIVPVLPGEGIQYRFAFSKVSVPEELVNRFDEALGELIKSGMTADVLKKYGFTEADLPSQ